MINIRVISIVHSEDLSVHSAEFFPFQKRNQEPPTLINIAHNPIAKCLFIPKHNCCPPSNIFTELGKVEDHRGVHRVGIHEVTEPAERVLAVV